MASLDTSLGIDGGDDRLCIRCFHCDAPQQVSRRALTVNCKSCHKTLKIEPITIKDYQARRAIETCGTLTIERKGNVFADRIACGSLVLRGRLRGHVVSRGPVAVAAEAELRGSITAPSIAVGEGAIIEADWKIGAADAIHPPAGVMAR